MLAAWVPTVEPQHVSGDCRIVEIRGGPDEESLAPDSSVGTRATSARFRSAARILFFNGDAIASTPLILQVRQGN